MIVLIETDILIDIGLMRKPFYKDSGRVIQLCENNKIVGFVAWHTLSNFYYLMSSPSGKKRTKEFIKDLLKFVKVAPVNTESAYRALLLKISDFEDALQISAAIECNADSIVTGNIKHYKNSPIPAITPKIFLKKFHSTLEG